MRSSIARLAVIVAAIVLIVPIPLAAQSVARPPARAPIWATLSAGRGDLRVTCSICRRHDQSSWAADVAVGGWIRSRSALGGELGAWRLGGDEATQRVMLVTLVSHLYPHTTLPAYVKLGVGLMGYRSSDGEQALSARSLALHAGFGGDIPVRRRYVIVPHATLVQGFSGGLYLDESKVTSASRVKLLRFGVGVGVR